MNRKLKILLAFLLALALFFLWGVTFYPCSATIPSGASLEPPSAAHYFGTDNLGIDIFAQLSRGFYVSMLIGVLAALVSFLLGGILGVLAGYYRFAHFFCNPCFFIRTAASHYDSDCSIFFVGVHCKNCPCQDHGYPQ